MTKHKRDELKKVDYPVRHTSDGGRSGWLVFRDDHVEFHPDWIRDAKPFDIPADTIDEVVVMDREVDESSSRFAQLRLVRWFAALLRDLGKDYWVDITLHLQDGTDQSFALRSAQTDDVWDRIEPHVNQYLNIPVPVPPIPRRSAKRYVGAAEDDTTEHPAA